LISKDSIDRIFEAARIEEVVSDFVQLKKAGSNFKGLSPWGNEKTPSFFVSPSKGIFKDFSSGKGGNAVSFLMELESMTYPEALRYIAKKYGIEIEETGLEEGEREEIGMRESLALINNFAAGYFTTAMWESDEGKSIGLSYFRERGFTDGTIKKFGLGYAFEKNDAFLKAAEEAGYKKDLLIKLGLTKEGEYGAYDFFRGRVIFPIRNVSGRNIAFAGRTLRSDNKVKYLNSPESELYEKSKVLYGMFEAKRSIISNDMCFLVEGYTDVISLHQAGVEYAVASSGTSLTVDQIKLIKRYTKNVSVLYDGDKAGINAALRGIDLLLEEGMQVRVVLFPEGHDPDSYARSVTQEVLEGYLKDESRDFTDFMLEVLEKEAGDDPIKRAGVARRLVESLSHISDHITRSIYVERCSKKLGLPEQALLNELNKVLRKRQLQGRQTDETYIPEIDVPAPQKSRKEADPTLHEREVVRILLNYGSEEIEIELAAETETEPGEVIRVPVAEYILHDLMSDDITFISPLYSKILKAFQTHFETFETFPAFEYFIKNPDPELSEIIASLVSTPYELSENWATQHRIYTETEDVNLKRAVFDPLMRLKLTRIKKLINTVEESIKTTEDQESLTLLIQEKMALDRKKSEVSDFFGSTII
jgi:DNA primase